MFEQVHKSISPALFVEEEITWRALKDPKDPEIKRILRKTLVSITNSKNKEDVSHWILRALTNFPESIPKQITGMLKKGALLCLGDTNFLFDYNETALSEPMPDWILQLISSNLKTAKIGVRFVENGIEFGDLNSLDEVNELELPATNPFTIDVSWTEKSDQKLNKSIWLKQNEKKLLPIEVDEVELKTLSGAKYKLNKTKDKAHNGSKREEVGDTGVMIQAFYWDCPVLESCEHKWWVEIKKRIPALQRAGFTAIWLPPVSKAASWKSMGYDPYDYYDLGEFDQKGGVPTLFGYKAELLDLIQTVHSHGMQVYADMVIYHNSGGDAEETNPIDGKTRLTKFNPASNKFLRDWKCFHPSRYGRLVYSTTFRDMPILCHRAPYVYTSLIEYAIWMIETIGFDGFSYNMVKGYGSWMIHAIQELRARDDYNFKLFGVGSYWDKARSIEDWLYETNAWSDNPVAAFDFPLRALLHNLCDRGGFSLRNLVLQPGELLYDRPFETVTFVENHDVARSDPIIQDKMLAYAYILTHEGYPCVFWQDYFNLGLALEDTPVGIAALVKVHEKYAGGTTHLLYVDDDLYVMQRDGYDVKRGLVLVLNNISAWNGKWVQTQWINTRLSPEAWYGSKDSGVPNDKWTNDSGWVELWAPPRGYTVYVPQ